MNRKILFVVNVDWFFVSHRLPIAQAAITKGYEVHIATALTDQLDTLQNLGLVVHSLDISRSSTNIYSTWQTLKQILSIYKRVKPNIVHLVTIKPVILGGIAARFAKIPVVVAAISGLGFVFIAKGIRATLRRFLVERLYRCALNHKNLMVIFQNKFDLESVSQLANLKCSQTTMIRGSGVALDKFFVKPLPNGAPVVLFAARMLKDKGLYEFVEAARILKIYSVSFSTTAARFVLVGEPDPPNPSSISWAELNRWQQEGLVEFWGHRTDMPDVLSAATIVVLPSYREGLPKLLIEAAACGRPVITTDVPGCRDSIEPGTSGLLVPAKDPQALASAIQSLLNDPHKSQLMGQAGRELAIKYFDIVQVVDQHLEIYNRLLTRV